MRILLSAAAFATLAAGAVAVADALPPTIDQVGLTWKRPPSLEIMRNRYPVRAKIHDVWKGQATVTCTANDKGQLSCGVLDEKPAGYDFGKAGVIVMEHAKVRSTDGGSPAGRTFRYGLKFGAWDTPARYQPEGGGKLQWSLMPSFKGWSIKDMKMGDVWQADVRCKTRAEGAIDCVLKSSRPNNASWRAAVLRAMNSAKVADKNGLVPKEGESFDYTVKVMRLNWCGTGGYRVQQPTPDVSSMAALPGAGADFVEIQTRGTNISHDSGSTCQAALALTQ